MKFKGHLMMGLIGLAMIAAPITVSAQNTDSHKHEASAPHAYSSTARENRTERNVAPKNVDRNAGSKVTDESHNERNRTEATNRDSQATRGEFNRSNDRDDNHRDNDYRNYGSRDYDHDHDRPRVEGYYVMPRGYAGGACAWARHLQIIYARDRDSGHPAAAADLLPQLRSSQRACGGVPYGYLR